MRTDQELLRDYTENGSEAAFSEVVRRHVDFVYSAALRLVRDAHLAEDVSQKVFLALAGNARQVANCSVIPGWLHRTTHHIAANTIRSDARRRAREQEAVAMNEPAFHESAARWESVAPHLDAALSELSEPDRDALILRYFQRKSAQEMAVTLGISGEAAQKRVNRAVERLRGLFAKRGIAVGANALVLLLAAHAVEAAPFGLAATFSTVALAGASAHFSTAVTTAKIITMTTLQKALATSALVVIVGFGVYQLNRTEPVVTPVSPPQIRLVAQTPKAAVTPANNAAPVTTAVAVQTPSVTVTNAKATGTLQASQLFAVMSKKADKLTLAQVQPYLDRNGRSAASLLAAFRTTADPSLLAEAMQKYPDDPQVGFEASIRNGASVEERRASLDAFKASSPDNAMADYLSALNHLKAGENPEAMQDLVTASGKPQFQDFMRERVQSDEEAYLAAGYPPVEARMIASLFLLEPNLAQIRELGLSVVDLAAKYQQAGDEASQAAALQLAVELGQRYNAAGKTVLGQNVGISIERAALNAMDPASPYGTAGQTVQDRLDQLVQQKQIFQALNTQVDPLWKSLEEPAWMGYLNQMSTAGEVPALRWLVANYGPK